MNMMRRMMMKEMNSDSSPTISSDIIHDEAGEEDPREGALPGFRFHPTDEELVSFYLKHKVENRPLHIELIKQIDIYKHDPWDLAKANTFGDKEWYFYCKRGRKYKNSIRPNRVTGSGFWKATGIDRPIYSNDGEGHDCIGLKKSLVYYRGSAGKGTKTDWMMHEFRLPNSSDEQRGCNSTFHFRETIQEAEIWTLCRIFKRNKKQTPDWRELSAKKNQTNNTTSSSKTSSMDSNTNQEHYINFAAHATNNLNKIQGKDHSDNHLHQKNNDIYVNIIGHQSTPPSAAASYSNSLNMDDDQNQFFPYGHNWDDLSSVVEFAVGTSLL